MLDNIAILSEQYTDPETIAPEDFNLYVRECEAVAMIEKDISEEVNLK